MFKLGEGIPKYHVPTLIDQFAKILTLHIVRVQKEKKKQFRKVINA